MKIVYEPKGAAREYAALACNIYKGCTHGCVYCYNDGRHSRKGYFFEDARPKKDVLKNLESDCKALVKKYGTNCPEILLTFLGDAYQPAEAALQLTRQAITILIEYNLRFTILTKSALIVRDLDLLAPYDGFRAGFSFTTVDPIRAAAWEPHAGVIGARIGALMTFYRIEVPTWVSLEPVMDVDLTIEAVEKLHSFVDFFYVGALNHSLPPKPIDLADARRKIESALQKYHCNFKFKSSFD